MAMYYLTASLPPLALDDPAPVSLDEFLASNAAQLSEEEMTELRRIESADSEGFRHPFLVRWRDFDIQLRNALARIRSTTAKENPASFMREHDGFDMRVERVAIEAMGMDDPLARELMLDRYRWDVIDNMVLSERFSVGEVYAFALKLRMVERWQTMTDVLGRETLKRLLAGNLESAAEGKAEE